MTFQEFIQWSEAKEKVIGTIWGNSLVKQGKGTGRGGNRYGIGVVRVVTPARPVLPKMTTAPKNYVTL